MNEEPLRGTETQIAKSDANKESGIVSVESIVQAVLRAHSDREATNRPQKPWWKQGLKFLVTNWGFTVFIASVLAILVAKALYGFSILYPFQELAFKEEELQQKKREFEHKREEFNHNESKFKREKKKYDSSIETAKDQVKLAKSFLNVGQYQEAAQAFEQALKFDRFNVEAKRGRLNSRVFELASSGQYDPEVVEKRLRFILAQNENDPHALTALGHLYARFDQPEAAPCRL